MGHACNSHAGQLRHNGAVIPEVVNDVVATLYFFVFVGVVVVVGGVILARTMCFF